MGALVELSWLLLATAALSVHVLLLSTAPLVAELVGATGHVLEGRTPPPFGSGWRSAMAEVRPGVAFVCPSVLSGFGLTAAAALIVPSFATGMVTGPLDDLVLVALLLVAARLASSWTVDDPVIAGRRLGAVLLLVPALLLAALALALIAGTTGLDAAIGAAPNAAAVPLGLVVLGLALAGLADLDGGETGLVGPMLALERLSAALRLLVWLDLVALFLPPWSTTASIAGPLAWLAALLLWPVKVGLLAIGLGVVRFAFGSTRSSWRLASLRASSLLALLGGVFVLIGQKFE